MIDDELNKREIYESDLYANSIFKLMNIFLVN